MYLRLSKCPFTVFQVSRNWLQHLCSVATISHSQHKVLYDYLLKTPDFDLPNDQHREISVVEQKCDTMKYDVDGSCLYAMEDFSAIRLVYFFLNNIFKSKFSIFP